MENLKPVRGGHRSAVTKLINRTDEKLESEQVKPSDLSAIIDSLIKKQKTLQTLDDQILELTDRESVAQEISDTDDFNLQLEITIRRYKEILLSTDTVSFTPTTEAISHTNVSTHPTIHHVNTNQYHTHPLTNTVSHSFTDPMSQPAGMSYNAPQQHRFYHKLPTLELPSFSGDVILWQTFWESFESTVHTNPALTNIQKFNYLKSQLRDDAERCISGLSLTNSNYDQAIFLLKDRFGQQIKS